MSWLVFAVLRLFRLPRPKRGCRSPRHTRPYINGWAYALGGTECETCHTENLMPIKLGRPRWRHGRVAGECWTCGAGLARELVFVPTAADDDEEFA